MKLKYTKSEIDVLQYPNGLEIWPGIDEVYANADINRKVILRIDALKCMSDIFTKESIEQCRRILFKAACNALTPEFYARLLTALVKEDSTFKDWMSKAIIECNHKYSIGEYFQLVMTERFYQIYNRLHEEFIGTSRFLIAMSEGYIYFSNDIDETEFSIPYDVEVEVMSDAKGRSYRATFNK